MLHRFGRDDRSLPALVALVLASALVLGLSARGAAAPLVYDQSKDTPNDPRWPRAVATTKTLDFIHQDFDTGAPPLNPDFNNCFIEEGCLAFLDNFAVKMVAGAPALAAANIGFERVPFRFTVTDALRDAVLGPAPGFARVFVQASRDFGLVPLAGAPPVFDPDLHVKIGDQFFRIEESFDLGFRTLAGTEGTFTDALFRFTPSSCGPPENMGTGATVAQKHTVKDIDCGPNFHTDVTAVDSIFVSKSAFRPLLGPAGDAPTFEIMVGHSGSRTKIFEVDVHYFVPNPPGLLALTLGLILVTLHRRRSGRARRERA